MRQRWLIGRWLVLGMLLLSSAAWAQRAQLEDVRVSTDGNRTRVVFALSHAINPDLFMLRDPARLVVDMPNTIKVDSEPEAWQGKGVVKRLRSGIRHGDDLRVVLDLEHLDIKADSYTLTANEQYGHRLVVDLYTQGAEPVPLASAARAAQQQADELATESGQGLTHAQASDAETTAEPQPVAFTPTAPTREIVVAVDPGHGGHDPGAIGPRGTREKHVVMAISRKLAAMIDEQPHMRAILTRKTDTYVGLRERMVIARQANADLFVSIHANSSVSPQPHGTSVFALSLEGATSERAHLLAERENAALMVGGVSLANKGATLASFMLDLAQSATIEASLDVGRRILNNLDHFTSLHQPRVEQAAFVVLKSPDMPSILVETGFISNPKEALKLQDDGYQTRVASAVLRGIKGYFDSYRPGTMIVKGQVHTVARGETLSGIAQQYHVSISRLREYNELHGSMIRIGQELRIPAPRQVATLR